MYNADCDGVLPLHCVVVSHKECWQVGKGAIGTIGGFPLQIRALSQIFSKTTVVLPILTGPPPGGYELLTGHCVEVETLPSPPGRDIARKLALTIWLPRHLFRIWRLIQSADVVHALVPGDLGLLGLLVARLQGKFLFVRHCGTWGRPHTIADRVLHSLLERIASDATPVLATGGGERPPSLVNRRITWIFSTTMSEIEIANGFRKNLWNANRPLRLATVCRLTRSKNVHSVVAALPGLLRIGIDVELEIAGTGPERRQLTEMARDLGVAGRVLFRGNLRHDEVLAMLARSDVLVFPTRVREGFPKAVLEAMALGVVVVATAVSVIPRLLANGAGIVLADSGPAAIVEAIRDVSSDPQRIADISARASEVASGMTLERWAGEIGKRVAQAWRCRVPRGA